MKAGKGRLSAEYIIQRPVSSSPCSGVYTKGSVCPGEAVILHDFPSMSDDDSMVKSSIQSPLQPI